MAIGEPEEEDMFTTEYEIETVEAAIEKVQSASPPSAPVFAVSAKEFRQGIRSLEDRVQKTRNLLGEAQKNHEKGSKEDKTFKTIWTSIKRQIKRRAISFTIK
jgi:hypothetical protein